MAQVTVVINGFTYVVGCEDGQEAHLLAMAGQVETRINSIKSIGGQTGEARLLVLACLLMADELHDTTIDMNNLRLNRSNAVLATRLDRLAIQAEEIAETIERG